MEYIKRTAVFEQFDNADADVCETDDFGGVDYGFGMKNIKELINAIPAADVAPVVHGQWQGEGDGYADGGLVYDVWYCSECGCCIDDGTDDAEMLPKYCPNCGAKMDGGNNDAAD